MTDTSANTSVAEPPLQSATSSDQKLDDVLLAMDVVDTLRHREQLVLREMDAEAREKDLIARLKDIYAAQGIEVTEDILRDGVKALEENRFAYTPPEKTLQHKLAYIYINRHKWLKPLAAIAGACVVALSAWHFAISAPQQAREKAQMIELTQTLPEQLDKLRSSTQEIAATDELKAIVEAHYQDALNALEQGDANTAKSIQTILETLKEDISVQYDVRIVSRPGEYSGLFRVSPGNEAVRNYYLIVEAISPTGKTLAVPVTSEETQAAKRVSIWGTRVTKSVFDQVSADKKDDQIIQNAIIGTKPVGQLQPDYTVETLDGAIFEW